MIEYKCKDPAFFMRSITSIAPIVSNTVIVFGKQLRMYGLDNGGLCLFDCMFGKEEFNISSDGIMRVSIDTTDLITIFKRFNNPDELSINYDNNQLIIKGKVDNRNKTFKLSVSSDDLPQDPSRKLTSLELNAIFNISLPDMLEMIDDGSIYGEEFRISTRGKLINVYGSSPTGEFDVDHTLEEPVPVDETATYSIEVTHKILEKLKTSNIVVSFAEEMPLSIYVKLSAHSHLQWFIAPRVDHMEDDVSDSDFEDYINEDEF